MTALLVEEEARTLTPSAQILMLAEWAVKAKAIKRMTKTEVSLFIFGDEKLNYKD